MSLVSGGRGFQRRGATAAEGSWAPLVDGQAGGRSVDVEEVRELRWSGEVIVGLERVE